MSTQDIRRVTDVELQESALACGKSVIHDLEKVNFPTANKSQIDSLSQHYKVRIFAIHTADKQLSEIERQLVDAYVASAGKASDDNLQKVGTDSLLYTKPFFKEKPDGTLQFNYAIGVMISKKVVVLSMPRH